MFFVAVVVAVVLLFLPVSQWYRVRALHTDFALAAQALPRTQVERIAALRMSGASVCRELADAKIRLGREAEKRSAPPSVPSEPAVPERLLAK